MIKNKLSIGCHVSAAGGVFNAPKNAYDLGCETFQIFTRPPMGGKAPEFTNEIVERFKIEMEKYYPNKEPLPTSLLAKGRRLQHSPSLQKRGLGGVEFVVHCPYFINFGSEKPRIYHGSISVVGEEMKRANMLGAKYVMTHLGSGKDLGQKAAVKQAQKGLVEVLKKYEDGSDASTFAPTSLKLRRASKASADKSVGGAKTLFLLEIAAGAGETLGGTFEQLAKLMESLVKFKTFGGVCFDTQHAFASGYDLRDNASVKETFTKFDKIIGLKWLKMSHINDSKIELGGKKDRHEHIGEGKIGEAGFKALLGYLQSSPSFLKTRLDSAIEPRRRGQGEFCLILETEHDKVKADIEILKKLRNKI